MDEFRDLEQMLEEHPLPIPEEALDDVSPWRGPLKKILWGLVLDTITINHWKLQYTLPAVGIVLLWLGWRSLRNENTWLRRGWLVSLLLMAKWFTVCVLRATPLEGGWERGWTVLIALDVVLMLAQYLCLWLGLRAVFQKTGQPPRTGAAAGLLALYLALVVMALLAPKAGTLVYGGMAVGYLGLIWAMWRVAHCLDQAGYALEPAPVKIPAKWAVTALALSLAAAVVGCMLVFARFPDQKSWQANPVPDSHRPTEMVELDERLIELGYPEELLADLSVEDRVRCLTAVGVDVVRGNFFPSDYWDTPGYLRLRTIQVVLADGTCRVFNHFRWDEEPKYRGMESLEIVPVFHDVGESWDDVSAHLFYQKDRHLYETEFARLEEISYGPVDCSLGSSNHGVIRAEFSLPKNGYGMRGYVAYDLIQDGDDWVNFNMGVNYTRTINPWVYPWQSPLDYRRPWGVNDGRLFRDAPYTGEFSMNNPKNPAWQALIPKEN